MKVVFLEPTFPEIHADDVIFPFGYAYLGAVLQRAGHKVEYVIPAVDRLALQDVVDHIAGIDTDLIGIGGLIPYFSAIIRLVRMIKAVRSDIPIVLGGPMVTYMPEQVLKKTGTDFCIAGEGEIALLKLVNCLESRHDYSYIPGLVFQRDGQIINNGMGESMPFEDIPMPNWADSSMEFYMYSDWWLPKWSRVKPKRVFTWMFSRGCPMKCNFCASGCEARYKTVNQSMAELRNIVDRFDPDYMMFVDNFLTLNKKYTSEFCEALITNGVRFKFSATGRVNVVDRQLLALMKKAGCQVIFYGLECANNDILRFMKKGITVEQTLKAIEMTKEAGIYPMVSIMFGQPGESFDDFFNSLQIALMTTDPHDPAPNIASVMPLLTFPGTGIYSYAKECGYFTNDEDYWDKYGDNFRIQYTDYTHNAVNQVVSISNKMYRWRYYQSMADNLLKMLQPQMSPYDRWKYHIKLFLKSHPWIRNMLSLLLGPQHIRTMELMGDVSDQEQVYKFNKRCITELVK